MKETRDSIGTGAGVFWAILFCIVVPIAVIVIWDSGFIAGRATAPKATAPTLVRLHATETFFLTTSSYNPVSEKVACDFTLNPPVCWDITPTSTPPAPTSSDPLNGSLHTCPTGMCEKGNCGEGWGYECVPEPTSVIITDPHCESLTGMCSLPTSTQ